jgi:hypothetical protein
MPLQILTLKLDGITASDYLTWCRDPDPPALDLTLRSIRIEAEPLGDTMTPILDWNQPAPAPAVAASAAELPLTANTQIYPAATTDVPEPRDVAHETDALLMLAHDQRDWSRLRRAPDQLHLTRREEQLALGCAVAL